MESMSEVVTQFQLDVTEMYLPISRNRSMFGEFIVHKLSFNYEFLVSLPLTHELNAFNARL